ncbi:MAG: DUF1292 domain-containing protein [Bacillota bacterium]
MNEEQDGSFWVDEENKELVLVENNQEQRFYIEEKLEIENNNYLVLIPSEEGEYDENEALVLKLEQVDDGEVLSVIEDDEEFEKVKEVYMER